MKNSTSRYRQLAWVPSILILSSCAMGEIDSRYHFRSEAAAAVSASDSNDHNSKALREIQIDLTALIEDQLTAYEQRLPLPPPEGKKFGRQEWLTLLISRVDVSADTRIRNSIVSAYMSGSSANCNVYLASLRAGQVTNRLATDVLATTFATASTLLRPEETSRILAALSGLSVATGATVDRNIFAQQAAELMADAIEQLRFRGRRAIEQRMALGYKDWPLGLALADLYDYQGDCSLLSGFQEVEEAVTQREAAIATLRNAAQSVEAAGGSASQVMAVFDAYGISSGNRENNILAAGEPRTNWKADLLTYGSEAMACLGAARAKLKPAADAQVANSTDLVSETGFVESVCETKTGFSSSYQMRAVSLFVAAELDGKSASDFETAYDSLVADYAEASQDMSTQHASRRQVLETTLENWEDGDTSRVVALISAIGGGTDFSTNVPNADPVFRHATLAAQTEMNVNGDIGSEAARMALASARAAVARHQ
jgi:hypothetical protein